MSDFTIYDNGTPRAMTAAEKDAHVEAQADAQEYLDQVAAAAAAKNAALESARTKLAALGLTEAEIKALVG